MMLKQKILHFLQTIPRDRVASYGYIAKKYNTSPRAVARILASNTDPVTYPCYKVVHTDGRVGWYSCTGGVAQKIKLLQADGIIIHDNKVDQNNILT